MLVKSKIRTVISIFFLGAIVAGCSASNKSARQAGQGKNDLDPLELMNAVGHARFTNLSGDTVNVANYRGKVVMIDFWETWCKPCINSFPANQKALDKYSDSFVVLAVTPGFRDGKWKAKSFADSHDYTFHYLMDSFDLHEKLGVNAIPFKVFIGPHGEFIKSEIGSKGAGQDFRSIQNVVKANR